MTPSQEPESQEPESSQESESQEPKPQEPEFQEPEFSEDLEPYSTLEKGGRRRWLAAGMVVGTGLVLSGAVAIGGWIWSRNHLAPWLSEQLTETLNRPVELGPVEQIGISGVRLGPSTIPPTPTDPDTLSLEAVEVRFRLLDLWRRELPISLTLEQGDLYLEQNADKQWFDLDIDLPDRDRDPFVDVRVDTIYVTDGQLTMVPYVEGAPEPLRVAISDLQGQLQFSNVLVEVPEDPESPLETQQLNLALSGTSIQGGSLNLKGAVLLPPPQDVPSPSADATEVPGPGLRANINLRTQAARATDILPLVDSFLADPLPVQFPSGLVSGQVDIESGRGVPTRIVGTARVDEASLITQGLPELLEDLQGDVRFLGRAIEFEGVTARLGALTAEAGGTLDFDTGYDLSGQVNPFTLAQATELFDVALPVATAGTFLANVTMTGPLNRPIVATDLISQGPVAVDQVTFATVEANTTLRGRNLAIDRVQALPQAGGAIAGSGLLTLGQPGQPGQLSLSLSGDQLPADALGRPYGLPETLVLGRVSTEVTIEGPLGQLTGNARWRAPMGTYPAQGTIALADNALRFTDTFVQVAGGTVVGDGTLTLGDRRWQGTARAVGLQLDRLGATVGGVVNGEAQFAGQLNGTGLGGVEGRGVAQAQLAGGLVTGQGTLSRGQWNADVRGQDLQLRAFAPDLQGSAGGQFRFTGTTDNLTLAGICGEGQAVLSDGLATAAPRSPQLAQVRSPLTADLAWNGQSVLVRRATTNGLQADGIVTPRFGGPGGLGIANLDLNLNADGLSLAALPTPEIIPLTGLAFFNGRLRGQPGALALSGNASLVEFTAAGLAFASPLSGPVTFAQGGALAVNLTGSGENRIFVATVAGSRDLDFEVVNDFGDLQRPNALATGSLRGDDLTATLSNLPLQGIKLPQSGLQGIGTVSGTVTSANIVANLRQPTLRATFDIQDPGLGYLSLPSATLPATTDTTPLAFPLDGAVPSDRPIAMETRYGQLQGTVTYANGVVGLVGVALESASGLSRYLASGTYTLADEPQLNGELVVENGQIQDILQTLLIFERADFRANLLQPPSWFPTGEVDISSLEEVSQVGDRNASLLDQLRRLAEVLELQDMLVAQADTAAFPPLEEFEGSFSGRVTATGPLSSDLAIAFDLAGDNWRWGDPELHANSYSYRIDEVIAQGRYQNAVLQLNPVSLRSDFSQFSPTTETGVALATLNGEFSFDPEDSVARTLRLEVSDVPMNAVRQPLRLPDNLDGLVNIGATLTGTRAEPQVRGQLAVNEATINRRPIDLAAASFGYQEARLNLLGRMAIQEQIDPLVLVASVPLTLPGVAQIPATDTVNVDLRLRDEGFALVNLFTQNITWESGPASLNLAVRGRWPQNTSPLAAVSTLMVTGGANLEGVTISARALPEPLTNLRGVVEVADLGSPGGDRTVVNNGLVLDFQNLRGDFSDGEVVAEGKLRLLSPFLPNGTWPNGGANDEADGELGEGAAPPPDDRFRLTLDNIALDLRSPAGTYRGNVNGNVVADGSVFFEPPLAINGAVQLSDGLLTLPETPERNSTTAAAFTPTPEPGGYSPNPLALEDFQLVLADNVRLAIPGIVDVRAEGSLNLRGTVPAVKPDGRINLPAGRINLLTTEFRLTGNENYAEFSELDETIDPLLVATLSAIVPDTAAAGNVLAVATPFPRNEISASVVDQLGLTQGGVQTVRIRASVNGRASRVVNLQDVELSSTPPRSDSEIIALVSGGFLAALESTVGSVSGGGDGFQGLLAFAGSALLNNLQNLLGSGLDRTELRLFSASPPGGQQGNAIDIGGEVGFNLSPNISVSVQKVFTNVTPALFSVRYRINDQFTLRAVTSYEQFNENTGAILEFGF